MYKKDDRFRLFVHLKMFKRDKNCVRFVSSLRRANEISKEKKISKKRRKAKESVGTSGIYIYLYYSFKILPLSDWLQQHPQFTITSC